MTIYCRTRIVFSTRHRPTIRPCHLSEFLASREWLTEKKAWPRHPLLSQKCIPLKKLLRYPLALCDPVACEGHARPVDRVLRRVNNRVDRKRVVEGKGVAVRVDLGGRRILKKKK